MIRFFPVALLAMLSAGLLTFCAPQPATAQPKGTASGQYINCAQVAADVSLMAQALKGYGIVSSTNTDWYSKVVIHHAIKAMASSNPAQYVRDLHKACLLETA